MRNAILGLALFGAVIAGTSAQANSLGIDQAGSLGAVSAGGLWGDRGTVQPIYWDGDACGPRCQEHRWREHERWEAHRRWEHRRWEERRYGDYAYPRY